MCNCLVVHLTFFVRIYSSIYVDAIRPGKNCDGQVLQTKFPRPFGQAPLTACLVGRILEHVKMTCHNILNAHTITTDQ